MSETAKKLFDGLKAAQAVAKDAALTATPGLKTFMPEVKAELSRMGTQGAMELASALFGNGAFVPYGPGQYTPDVEKEHVPENANAREGLER